MNLFLSYIKNKFNLVLSAYIIYVSKSINFFKTTYIIYHPITYFNNKYIFHEFITQKQKKV